MLGVDNLTVRYGTHTALEGATVRFEAGQFSAVIGPNGAGKSTLLKTVVGLSAPAAGRVTFGPGMGAQSDVAYVPQDPSSALNPSHRIGAQLRELLDLHDVGPAGERDAAIRAILPEGAAG